MNMLSLIGQHCWVIGVSILTSGHPPEIPAGGVAYFKLEFTSCPDILVRHLFVPLHAPNKNEDFVSA